MIENEWNNRPIRTVCECECVCLEWINEWNDGYEETSKLVLVLVMVMLFLELNATTINVWRQNRRTKRDNEITAKNDRRKRLIGWRKDATRWHLPGCFFPSFQSFFFIFVLFPPPNSSSPLVWFDLIFFTSFNFDSGYRWFENIQAVVKHRQILVFDLNGDD